MESLVVFFFFFFFVGGGGVGGVTVASISLIDAVMRGVFRYFLMGLLDTSVAAFNKIILDVARSSTKYIKVLNIKQQRQKNNKKNQLVV